MHLSIVIPVFNSEKILPELVKQIQAHTAFADSMELILVNDRSKDNSWSVIKELCKVHSFIIGINLRKNTGQHNAIMAGLNHTSGDVIVMMDDDLQHSPVFIHDLYKEIITGNDVCYTKFPKTHQVWWKVLGSRLNDKAASVLLRKPKNLYLSPFKAISKSIRDEIVKYNGPFTYIDGLILRTTDNITSLEVPHFDRYEGKGNYSFVRSLVLWLKMSTGFSLLPLRLATFFGIGFSIITFILAIYYFLLWLVTPALPQGWTTLILVVLFLGGIQLFTIGIIGEYIGRTYLNINRQPQFLIESIIGSKNSINNEK